MNQTDFAESPGVSGLEVFGHHIGNIAGGKGVEIDEVLDGELDRNLRIGHFRFLVVVLVAIGFGRVPPECEENHHRQSGEDQTEYTEPPPRFWADHPGKRPGQSRCGKKDRDLGQNIDRSG